MDTTDQFFILFIFLFFSAFFSGVETAFTSLSDIRIQHLVEQNRKGIRLVKKLSNNRQRLLVTILIGNNFVNITASALATSLAEKLFADNGISIAIGVMTFAILVFGEITPKTLAMAKNETVAIFTAPFIRVLQLVLYPIIMLLEGITNVISRPISGSSNPLLITEAEIKSVVSLGEELGEVEEDEKIMIHNIFRFSDLEAHEIMIDRTMMFVLDAENDFATTVEQFVKKGFSRIPVYEEKIDNVIGVLYIRDVLLAAIDHENEVTIKELLRPAKFIPETMLLDDLLRDFQAEQVHIAMVVDEHGGISGLITIEDILEEIVGEIIDETDKEQVMIRKLDAYRSLVRGQTEIEKVNEELELDLNERDDYETISGFILSKLRKIPEVGEELALGVNTIRITKADEKRIIEVQIDKPAPPLDQEKS